MIILEREVGNACTRMLRIGEEDGDAKLNRDDEDDTRTTSFKHLPFNLKVRASIVSSSAPFS